MPPFDSKQERETMKIIGEIDHVLRKDKENLILRVRNFINLGLSQEEIGLILADRLDIIDGQLVGVKNVSERSATQEDMDTKLFNNGQLPPNWVGDHK